MLRRRVCLVFVALAAVPAAADAAYPGTNGSIIYRGARDGASVLYVRDGHTVAALPIDTSALSGATFSPHGRRIAAAAGGNFGLVVMDADGSDLRAVTPGVGAARPSWSPDGAQLAFTGKQRIEVVGADGTDLHGLVTNRRAQSDPSWSVTGSIAYVQRTAHGTAISVVAAAGGKPRRLTSDRARDSAPSWAPDGRSIAFVRAGQGVWVMDADGRHAHRVVNLRGVGETAPAWAPDGSRILFSAGRPGTRRIWSVRPDGRGLTAVSTPSSDGREPDWQPAGAAPVVMAAGDIACAPTSPNYNGGLGFPSECAEQRTSNLLARADLDGILVVGDGQYETGQLADYDAVFAPTWGRFRSLLHPVPGNHEYSGRNPTATGYFDFFNGPGNQTGPAGDRAAGYYSFDIGTWHVVALNSNCRWLTDGCAAGSPEEQWLRADLAAHPAACTLAFMHHPRFGSAGNTADVAPLYQALYDGGVDVLLAGHHHLYERFAPLNPAGAADDARGLREFIVGTGGKSLVGASGQKAGSAVLDASTFGVLQLTLGDGGYAWRFDSAGPGALADAGLARCH